jgi:hypothetical protein
MSTLTALIDPGNFSTKYVYRHEGQISVGSFHSITHEYEQMESGFHDEVKHVEYKSYDYYIGKGAAKFHSDTKLMYRGNTRKGHHDGLIRIIAALHEIHEKTGADTFNIVITSPYASMQKDKKYFERMLQGECETVIDGRQFNFSVEHIRVAAEGLGALSFAKVRDCVVLDAGSMTMNILYLIDGTINAKRSKTLNGGTTHNKSHSIADSFTRACPDVEYEKTIVVTGGKAEEIAEELINIGYENTKTVVLEEHPPYYVNVVGLFMTFEKRFEVMFT